MGWNAKAMGYEKKGLTQYARDSLGATLRSWLPLYQRVYERPRNVKGHIGYHGSTELIFLCKFQESLHRSLSGYVWN